MKIFRCTNHDTHFPVGGASIVVASDIDEARKLLDAELKQCGLIPDNYTLDEIDITKAQAIILNDGNY